jgi:tRNA dimethylallyltransferase
LHSHRNLIVIAGPTGSGKSELSLRIAERFGGEVVNCDSVQIYRLFNIGAAKLAEKDRRGIPHHLIDIADPPEVFTAGDFARIGRPVLRAISDRSHLPIVTGGTGLYLRALIDGFAPAPQRDDDLRERLRTREAARPGSVHRILRRFDPEAALRIHPNDLPKVIRALEIGIASRSSATAVFAAGRDRLEGYRVLKIGLFPPREKLYERLEIRMEAMFALGLIEETAAILAHGYPESCKAFESIGYKQALQVLKGELSPRDALFYARRETRRYAKRQMTWFRQEPGLEIFSGFGDDAEIIAQVEQRIATFSIGTEG